MQLDPSVELELAAYAEHIRNIIADAGLQDRLQAYLPLTPESFFAAFEDGVLLGNLLNLVKPGCLDTSKLKTAAAKDSHVDRTKSAFDVKLNLNYCIESATKAGFVTVNIGSEDFLGHQVDLVLGLVWQVIRAHLLQEVNLVAHPELIRLLEKGETIPQLTKLTPEQLLIRWFNYHLARAGVKRRVANFSADIQDGSLYIELLARICDLNDDIKKQCTLARGLSDGQKRANAVLYIAEQLKARKFVSARAIVNGNARLNLAFTATLFNRQIGIHLPDEDEIKRMLKLQLDLAAQVQSLSTANAEKDAKIAAQSSTINDLSAKLEAMQAQLNAVQSTLSKELDEKTAALQELSKNYADAQAADQLFRDNVTAAVKSIVATIRERTTITDRVEGAGKVSASSSEESRHEITSSLEFLDRSVDEITGEANLLRAKLDAISSRLGKQELLNDIMGDKIKQYSEEMASRTRQGWFFKTPAHGKGAAHHASLGSLTKSAENISR